MTGQAATRVVSVEGLDRERPKVVLELACGCTVEREIARDRLLELGGELRAVGKYACALGHPVRRPGS